MGGNKEPAGVLDGGGVDAPQDGIFVGALRGGLGVGNDVASPRVKQSVEPGGGSLGEVGAFQERGFEAAHREVSNHSHPGDSASDNHDLAVPAHHGLSLPRSRDGWRQISTSKGKSAGRT